MIFKIPGISEIPILKKGGNWIQKAVNPKHRGFCTPMTKATCTPKRKALARTFKKMAKNEFGGQIASKIEKKPVGAYNTIPSYKDGTESKRNAPKYANAAKCGKKLVKKKMDGGNVPPTKSTKPIIHSDLVKHLEKITVKKEGAKLTKEYIKKAHEKPGGSNVGKKTFADGSKRTGPYVGPSGGAPKGSYPIPDLKHAKSALSLAHNAPNPQGVKNAVYKKYPQLAKKQQGGELYKNRYSPEADKTAMIPVINKAEESKFSELLRNKTFNYDDYLNKASKYMARDVFKNSVLTPKDLSDSAFEFYKRTGYKMPLEFILTQGQQESSLGTRLKSKNNIFNVGNTTEGATRDYESPRAAVDDYLKLIYNDYLQKGKKPLSSLLQNDSYRNYAGNRYAADPTYEQKIANQMDFITKFLTSPSSTSHANK